MDIRQLAKYKYYYPFEDIYADISGIGSRRYDDSGVVMYSKDNLANKFKIFRDELYQDDNNKYFYHPCSVAQCAQGTFNLMTEGHDNPYKDIFMANINWLLENGIAYKDSIVYPFPFGLPDFHPDPDWVSGMCQGQILSALVRAYIITNDNSIYSTCEGIKQFFPGTRSKIWFPF